MRNTFKKSITMPVMFDLTDEQPTDVIYRTEYYINCFLEEKSIASRFFGKLQNKVSKVTASVSTSDIKLTFLFDHSVKDCTEEIEEQMSFIAYNILRPELHCCNVPEVESKMHFENPAPNNFYKRNIFLENLAIKVDSYGTNFVTADDNRRIDWQNQELRQGFDDRETWNLSTLFIEWLYSRLTRYMEVTLVDVEATKYTFKILDTNDQIQEVTMTMKEAAAIILDACTDYLTLHDADIEADQYRAMIKKMTYALRIWAELFPAFWW